MKWTISLILILLLASCTSQVDHMDDMMDAEDMSDMMDNSKTITIQGSKYMAESVEVKKGDTVTWINKDSAPHTVTGENFDSGTIGKDETFIHTFTETGTFEYGCTIHPFMKGEVVVS